MFKKTLLITSLLASTVCGAGMDGDTVSSATFTNYNAKWVSETLNPYFHSLQGNASDGAKEAAYACAMSVASVLRANPMVVNSQPSFIGHPGVLFARAGYVADAKEWFCFVLGLTNSIFDQARCNVLSGLYKLGEKEFAVNAVRQLVADDTSSVNAISGIVRQFYNMDPGAHCEEARKMYANMLVNREGKNEVTARKEANNQFLTPDEQEQQEQRQLTQDYIDQMSNRFLTRVREINLNDILTPEQMTALQDELNEKAKSLIDEMLEKAKNLAAAKAAEALNKTPNNRRSRDSDRNLVAARSHRAESRPTALERADSDDDNRISD